jgi:hypothetical protein
MHREENLATYAGVASYIALFRGRQDHEHGGKKADTQVLHTDSNEMIALFVLGEAAEGGQGYLKQTERVQSSGKDET